MFNKFKKNTADKMYQLAVRANAEESIESMRAAESDVKIFLKGIEKAAKEGFYYYFNTVDDPDSTYRFTVSERLREYGFKVQWEVITLVRYQLSVNWDLSNND